MPPLPAEWWFVFRNVAGFRVNLWWEEIAAVGQITTTTPDPTGRNETSKSRSFDPKGLGLRCQAKLFRPEFFPVRFSGGEIFTRWPWRNRILFLCFRIFLLRIHVHWAEPSVWRDRRLCQRLRRKYQCWMWRSVRKNKMTRGQFRCILSICFS